MQALPYPLALVQDALARWQADYDRQAAEAEQDSAPKAAKAKRTPRAKAASKVANIEPAAD